MEKNPTDIGIKPLNVFSFKALSGFCPLISSEQFQLLNVFYRDKKQFLAVKSLIDSSIVCKIIAILSGQPANLTRAL